MSGPDKIWAWKWNWIGDRHGKPCWSDYPPAFPHLKLRKLEKWWHLWGPMENVPQDVTEYTRADLIPDPHDVARAALEAAAKACEKERDDARANGCSTEAIGAIWSARAIRALANDPAALAEIVGRVNSATEKE